MNNLPLTRRAIQDITHLDEQLFKLGQRLRSGTLDEWERGFALSVLGQAKHPRRSPFAKQLAIIERLLAKPARTAGRPDELLIDGGDHDFAA